MNAQKKIETTTTYKAIYKFGKIKKGDLVIESSSGTRYYNQKGNPTMVIWQEKNCGLSEKYFLKRKKLKYNTKDKLIESVVYILEEGREFPLSKTLFEYDFKENLITEEEYLAKYENQEGNVYDYLFLNSNLEREASYYFDYNGETNDKYNDEGNDEGSLIETLNSDLERGASYYFNYNGETNYKYNDEGGQIETAEFDKDLKLVRRWRAGDNLYRNLDITKKRKKKGESKWKTIEELNIESKVLLMRKEDNQKLLVKKNDGNQDNLIDETDFLRDGNLESKSIYFYDENKNLIESLSYDTDGILLEKSYMKYNSEGDLIQNIDYSYADESEDVFEIVRTDWEYDEYRNCILSIEYINDIPQLISIMEIEYY